MAAATSRGAVAQEASTAPDRQGLVLAALILVAAVANLPLASANVALPSIGLHFDASQTQLNLVAVSYSLGLAVSVLWFGAVGDRYGRKQMMLIGVLISLPAVLVMAWAPNIGVLIGARFVGGLAAGMAYPTTLSLITALWSGARRTRGIALWSAIGGGVSALGPLLAGLFLSRWWWGSVFLITVPLIVIAVPLAYKVVPSHVNETDSPVDDLGGILSLVLVGTLILAINFVVVPDKTTLVISLAIIAVAALVAFVLRERRAREPLYDLTVARRRVFWVAACAGIIVFGSLMGAMFIGQQFLQNVLGYSTVDAGPRHPARRFLHGAHRATLGQAGGDQGLPLHAPRRLCLHLPRLPHHAVVVEGGHPLLEGGLGVRVHRRRDGIRRDSGVAFAHWLRTGDAGRHGVRHGRPPARPGWRDLAIDHGCAAHRRLRRRLH